MREIRKAWEAGNGGTGGEGGDLGEMGVKCVCRSRARDIKEGVCERMSLSEREEQLRRRVGDLEAELAVTRREYYAMKDARDALLKTSRQKNPTNDERDQGILGLLEQMRVLLVPDAKAGGR